MLNLATAGVDYHVRSAAVSSSGAREQGIYAAEVFTTVKSAYRGV